MSSIISAATLMLLRSTVNSMVFSQSAQVLRQGDGDDGAGGSQNGYQPVEGMGSVPCAVVDPSRSREQLTGEEIQSQADAEIEFAVGTDIRDEDQIIVEGVKFEVLGTDAARALATKLTASVVRK